MKRTKRGPLIESAEKQRKRSANFAQAEKSPGSPEKDLADSERRLQSVIQGSPIPTFVIGRDHRILYWNRALEELSGIRAHEVLGTADHWRAFYRSGARPCLADLLVDQDLDAIESWYAGKCRKSTLIEEAYEATDFFPELGEGGRWLRFTAALIRGSGGEVVGAQETLENITERKLAEESLKDSERRLQSVIQGSPIPTFVIGRDHRILYWNRALEELSGIRAHEVLGTADHWRAFYRSGAPTCSSIRISRQSRAGMPASAASRRSSRRPTRRRTFSPNWAKGDAGCASRLPPSTTPRAGSWGPWRRWRTSRSRSGPRRSFTRHRRWNP
jgi:PAS domain-containing protein